MEVSFSELKEKEIINVFDGKKLGRIIDILFDNSSGVVKGVVVPGEKKIFRKSEDIFVPLEKLKKIGDDVILVGLQLSVNPGLMHRDYVTENQMHRDYKKYITTTPHTNAERRELRDKNGSFVRYKRIDNKKYK